MTAFDDPAFRSTGVRARLARVMADGWRHAEDVNRLFDQSDRSWTEALLSETRAQLSGCFNAVGQAIALGLGTGWLARPVEALGPAYCGRAIERMPELLTPLLVDHMRQRAAAALAVRAGLDTPAAMQPFEAEEPHPPEGPLADHFAAHRLTLGTLIPPPPLDLPVRPDLAAEPFCDLVWSATALLIDGLAERLAVDPGTSVAPMERVAEAVIGRHDEANGLFARAALVACTLPEAELDNYAAQAVIERDLLILAAAGARRCAMPAELGMALLLDGSDDERAAFAWRLALPAPAMVALEDILAPILGLSDRSLADRIARYRSMDEDSASALLVRWRVAPPLAARLARLRRFTAL